MTPRASGAVETSATDTRAWTRTHTAHTPQLFASPFSDAESSYFLTIMHVHIPISYLVQRGSSILPTVQAIRKGDSRSGTRFTRYVTEPMRLSSEPSAL